MADSRISANLPAGGSPSRDANRIKVSEDTLSRVNNPVCVDAKHQHSGPQNSHSFIKSITREQIRQSADE